MADKITNIFHKHQSFLNSFRTSAYYQHTFNHKFYKSLSTQSIHFNQQSLILDQQEQISRIDEETQQSSMMVIQYQVDSIPKEYQNAFGVVHGGIIASYIDIVTTAAIYTFDLKSRGQLSVKLNTNYINSQSIDHHMNLQAIVDKVGNNLAFSQCKITNQDGKLVATGSHIKGFIQQQYKL